MTTRTWPSSHSPTNEQSIRDEDNFDVVTLSELQQGELYIVKIKLVTIALFQGWQDETCCFYVLRTDLSDPTRWSEAKYLPNNFDAYPAFDRAGNPSIQLWTQQLKSAIPSNWFSLFEEAKMIQSQWYGYEPNAVDAPYEPPLADREALVSPSQLSYSGAERMEDQTKTEPFKTEVDPQITSQKPNQLQPSETQAKDSGDDQEIIPRSSSLPGDRIAQRKSWSSFFLKKKKSKKSLREKRESVPVDTYPTLAERTETQERLTAPPPEEHAKINKKKPLDSEKPLLNLHTQTNLETDTFMDFRLALAFLDNTPLDPIADFGQQKLVT
ncbi:hypothetical protein BY458DRAFT_530382 [Sporodiniella umbellata]|nr:hypothetical protein BY458DRAFT_530382 [Sporodiniella umbellata]